MQKITCLLWLLFIENDHYYVNASGVTLTVLLTESTNEYVFSCCGYIQSWEYYSKDNTGTVNFQVWRDTTSTWTVVGENTHTHSTTAENRYQFTPASANQVLAQSGDVIGLHFPGDTVVTYDHGETYKRTTSYTTGSATFNWDSVSSSDDRDFSVKAILGSFVSPTIDNLDSTVTFSDQTSIGTLLYTLTVSDSDTKDTQTTTVTSNSGSAYFDFTAGTLQVTTKAALSSGTYTMGFQVTDLCSLTDTGTLTIIITNTPPTINNLPGSYSLSEDQTAEMLLYTINATDPSDSVSCSITSSNPASAPFTIKADNGLYVQPSPGLDYDVAAQYDLTIQCTDTKDTVSGSYTINVIPNVPPTIHNLPGSYYLSEDQTSEMLLYTINATDPTDSVSCSISSSNPASAPFTIRSDNGIYVQSSPGLDYDVVPQYILNIQCTDTKDPVSDTYTVYIVPNIPPTIHNLPSAYILSEDQEVEMLLYTLNVTDATNEAITCSITSPASSPFFAKPVSGTSDYGIYVQHTPNLDYDLISQYDLTVECADSRTAVTGVYTVTLLENNPPVFVNLDNTTSISTLTSGLGELVFQVSVSDAENDSLHFNMTCNPTACPFSILSSGDIHLTESIYGTSIPSYDLYINVFDGRTLVGPKTLTVSVTDINYAPSFNNLPTPSTLIVYENSALGASVFQISVSDPNVNDSHVYIPSFNPATGTKYFKLNSASGLLTTSSTNTIDYEALSVNTFTVNVSVSDGFTFSSETLDIFIADVNEAPVFQKSFYTVSGNEDNLSGVKYDVGFIVNDPDSGSSQTYTMDCGTYQAYFTMETTSGNVTYDPGYDLDIGTNPSVFTCNVTVSDGQYTDTSELEITVNQINDNLPQFTRPTYTFYISADDGIGTTVGVINATDQDIGTYGTLSYSLNQTSITCDCFAITDTGVIYVQESLNTFAEGTVLNIKVIATDGGNLQSIVDVTVVILPIATTVSTTTTDRYLTFWEDPRNTIWVALTVCALFGWLCLMVYFTYSFGWLDGVFKRCAQVRMNFRRRAKPVQRPVRREPPRQRHYDTELTTDITSKADPDANISEKHRRLWHTTDFINNSHSVSENQWEPWRTKDFLNSTYS